MVGESAENSVIGFGQCTVTAAGWVVLQVASNAHQVMARLDSGSALGRACPEA